MDSSLDEDAAALYDSLVQVLQGRHSALQSSRADAGLDEVLQTTLRLYQTATATPRHSNSSNNNNKAKTKAKALYATWLATPQPVVWVQALVDVATLTTDDDGHEDPDGHAHGSSNALLPKYSSYTRVLALQVLVQAGVAQGPTVQQALLETPQGLLRLAELLNTSANTDAQVRTVALSEVAPLIASWPAAAKVWVFSEVPQTVLELLVRDEGGLTGGSLVVLDGLRLITTLLSHDASAAELVVSSAPHRTLGRRLGQLLDLRQAQAFCQPPSAAHAHRSTSQTPTATQASQEDDLDDLLASGGGVGGGDGDKAPSIETPVAKPVPRLLPSEEDILRAVLDLLRTLLAHDRVRQSMWRGERPLLSLTWDWALMGPAPPQPVCGVPSIELQCTALEFVAEYMNDSTILLDLSWHGLDRLLYLICTGGPGVTRTEQLQISNAAVACLRSCLTDELAQDLVLAALAPPPEDLTDGGLAREAAAQQRIVLPKLLQTVLEHLTTIDVDKTASRIDLQRHEIGLQGSLAALALFQGDTEGRRSLLLKLTTPTLVHDILERLAYELEQQKWNSTVVLSMLRFLTTWMEGTPLVVQVLLQNAESSAVLGGLAGSKTVAVATMASLVLGLALTDLDEHDCGGWTRATIVAMLSRTGLTNRIRQWEDFKSQAEALPWTTNSLEDKVWQTWYAEAVLKIRKGLVQHLTGSGSPDDGSDDNDGGGEAPDQPSRKALQDVVGEQAAELERIRTDLAVAKSKIQVHGRYWIPVLGLMFSSELTLFGMRDLQRKNWPSGSNESRVPPPNSTKCCQNMVPRRYNLTRPLRVFVLQCQNGMRRSWSWKAA
jgi:hypothetical protein